MEQVSYAAAYGDERMPAYLFLPKKAKPPVPDRRVLSRVRRDQPAIEPDRRRLRARELHHAERPRVAVPDLQEHARARRCHHQRLSEHDRGLARSHGDVVEGRRPDDRLPAHRGPTSTSTKIGYMGYSWGAGMAPLFLAVEPQVVARAVDSWAVSTCRRRCPRRDPVNFAARVKIPVVMLNGRFDFFFPTETSQKPMFRSLGTPAEHKRRVVYRRLALAAAQRRDQGVHRLDG